MRLADFIRWKTGKPLGQFYREGGFIPDDLPVSLADVPDELPVYSVDAICEYLFAGTAQEVWDIPTDFPRCLPQHPDLFIEMSRPSKNRSEASGTNPSSTMPRSWGWLISCRNRRDLPLERRAEQARQMRDRLLEIAGDRINLGAVDSAMKASHPMGESFRLNVAERLLFRMRTLAGERVTANSRELPPARPPSAPGWMMWASQICDYAGRLGRGFLAFELDLNEDGTIAAAPTTRRMPGCPRDDFLLDIIRHDSLALLFPALLALSLVNRGQAKIQRRDPLAALNRLRTERGKPLLQPYWSIERKDGAAA